jgi:hypothetical protein
MVAMELHTIYSETKGSVTYNECELTSEDKSLLGQPRLVLQVIVTEESLSTQQAGVNIHDAVGDIAIIETINASDIITNYTHRPMIDFDRVIIDIDTSATGNEVIFDLNAIDGMDDIKALIIRNPSEPKRVKIRANLNTDVDPDGNVIAVAAVPSISLLRFENCVFDEGITIRNRTKILLELYSCDLYKYVSVFENREPYPVSTMNVLFENCSFFDIKTFLISRLVNLIMTGTSFTNAEKVKDTSGKDSENVIDDQYELNEGDINDYIDPSIKISGCTNVEITTFDYKNIFSSIEIIDCMFVAISDISGTHQVPNKPTSRPFVIHQCTDVTATNIRINGLRIDMCETATVAGVSISSAMCANAAFGIMLSRIFKEAVLSDLKPGENTVMTGCVVSMCEGNITVTDPVIQGIPIGIYINGCSGDVNIANAILKQLSNCAVLVKSTYGKSKLLDSMISNCNTAIYASEAKSFEIVGGVIMGRDVSGPVRDKKDIICSTMESLRTVDNANLSGLAIAINVVTDIELQKTIIDRSYLDIKNISSLSVRDTLISADDIPAIDDITPFMLNAADAVTFIGSRFQSLTPDLKYVGTIKIQDTELFSGIRTHYSGDVNSEIRSSQIGNPSNVPAWQEGIYLSFCAGITITDTTFNAISGKTVITLNQCRCCIINDSNVYVIDNLAIECVEGDINNNHFILPTKNVPGKIRPKLTTSSSFKDLLYFLAISEYRKRYGNTVSPYHSIDEVMKQRLNIVSYVDREESWVPSVISRINNLVKTELG